MNYLSKNIRYLRKQKKWSQEELALHLAIKRSNIAAYESKNVEPRLALLLKISNLFETDLASLIGKDLENQESNTINSPTPLELSPSRITENKVNSFSKRTVEVRKMLEGFKAFYTFRKENHNPDNINAIKLSSDIDNLILLIDHLLATNEQLLNNFTPKKA